MENKSAVYQITKKIVEDEYEKLRRDKITSWLFLHSGHSFKCKKYSGEEISYIGEVRFEGSPEIVFWNGFIEPFLEDISFRLIDKTIQLCKDKKINLPEPLREAGGLLKVLVRKVYEDMVDVDRRLRGNGYPRTVEKKDVTTKISSMERFIDERVESELSIWEKPSKYTKFYHNHPFLFWLIATVISVVIGIVGIIIAL